VEYLQSNSEINYISTIYIAAIILWLQFMVA